MSKLQRTSAGTQISPAAPTDQVEEKKDAGELTDEELRKISGGFSVQNPPSPPEPPEDRRTWVGFP